MKKRLVKALISLGWYKTAWRISPSLAMYYAGEPVREAFLQGLLDNTRTPKEKE